MKKDVLLLRLPREYRKESIKFGILHFFLIAIISVISGFLSTSTSFDKTVKNFMASSNTEDGHFATYFKMSDSELNDIKSYGDLSIEPQFYYDSNITNSAEESHSIRLLSPRDSINTPTLWKGKLPTNDSEIVIEELYAKSNKKQIGDTISTEVGNFTISGIASFPDYAAVYKSVTDITFQHQNFCVALINGDFPTSIPELDVEFVYAYRFNNIYSSKEFKEKSIALKEHIETLLSEGSLNLLYGFSPSYANKNINGPKQFSGQFDGVVLIFNYLVVVVIAFVFAINTLSRVQAESKTIGTLKASGYSVGSIVSLNLILPIFVTITSALLGNLLGYLVFSKVFSNLFLSTFSIPNFTIYFSSKVLLLTTLVPSLIMLLVNFFILWRTINIPTLKFLQNRIFERKGKKAVKLNPNISFFNRFRARIIFSNITNYIVIAIGALMGSVLFSFGVTYRNASEHQIQSAYLETVCDYQYALNFPFALPSEEVDAEGFSAYSFSYHQKGYLDATIFTYGIQENSNYIDVDAYSLLDNEVFASSAFLQKYDKHIGNSITCTDINTNKEYTYIIKGEYKYSVAPCLVMPIGRINSMVIEDMVHLSIEEIEQFIKDNLGIDVHIDLDNLGFYMGFFSNKELDFIPSNIISTLITKDILKKDAERIGRNVNTVSTTIMVLGIVIDILLTFLLTKQIIEKCQKDISLCKILGMNNKEVASIYITATTIVVVLSLLVAAPITYGFNLLLFKVAVFSRMVGYIKFFVPWWIYLITFVCGLLSYFVAVILQFYKIKKIPMVQALKD